MRKVLIIKLGYSETLDPEIGQYSSLGDILRTTVILHEFKDDHVTWLVDERGYPLLKGNPRINRILFYNLTTALQLMVEHFDIVVNFEKVPGICALTDMVSGWGNLGYRFDRMEGVAQAFTNSEQVIKIYTNFDEKRNAKRAWQDVLYEMLGKEWKGEEYILGYKPKGKIEYDVGLNWSVGEKWPNKAWPYRNFIDLKHSLASHKLSVNMQQGQGDLERYMDWVNSCRCIVTNDSLGLHIAIALKKKIVALFGPTSWHETPLYGLGSQMIPVCKCEHMPCLKPVCDQKVPCIESITVKQVHEEVRRVLD